MLRSCGISGVGGGRAWSCSKSVWSEAVREWRRPHMSTWDGVWAKIGGWEGNTIIGDVLVNDMWWPAWEIEGWGRWTSAGDVCVTIWDCARCIADWVLMADALENGWVGGGRRVSDDDDSGVVVPRSLGWLWLLPCSVRCDWPNRGAGFRGRGLTLSFVGLTLSGILWAMGGDMLCSSSLSQLSSSLFWPFSSGQM